MFFLIFQRAEKANSSEFTKKYWKDARSSCIMDNINTDKRRSNENDSCDLWQERLRKNKKNH